ncbi:GNAT family N-acetyltransferase [Nonomuraea glycinis]|uniref:Acetyltransferase n=1 Tax=Nonomuraea glycinis TaxID=2047744 RepID=A0A918AG11_9ACTN|nr:GNAT family N-acetyltransferase [Nonomuraea glycinis]MCA2176080.1 GNAT family N-acetyltransferase [Nonomuraea glycinis]GGP17976.1 acetyltransferase [Nonomuraea glycinis]
MLKPLSIRDLQPQLAANRRYWTGLAGAEGADDPGASLPIYRTGIAHPLLNGVLRVRAVPLDDAVAEARQRLDGSVWTWWVGADSDEGTAERLMARGADEIVTLPIMAMDLDRVATFEAPGNLRFRTITGAAEMAGYVATFAGPMGIATGLDLVAERELAFGCLDVVRRAAVIDGRMVGTCTLSLGTDVAALYCIATHPDHRRRGIATALTLDALRIARNSGRRIATLQSSSAGEPVYRRIGFETVSHYRLFAFGE